MQLNNHMPKDIDSVSKVIVCWKKRCLLLRREDDKGWELPGGHLNEGETFLRGAKREVFEETGIKIQKNDTISPFFLFESVSMRAHKTTPPSSGHLIIFYKV